MTGQSTKSSRPSGSKIVKATSDGDNQRGSLTEIPVGRIFIIVLAVSALLVGIYIQITKNLSESFKKSPPLLDIHSDASHGRLASGYETLIVADNMDAGYLDHIIDGLINFGHKLSFSGSLTPQKASDENLQQFNLIWTHDYPFQAIKKLHPHQRINHFPGTGFITNKLTLSTTPRVPHVLKAFRLPQERDQFIKYAEAKQGAIKSGEKVLWIRKGSGHRGISIETLEGILEREPASGGDDILVQEYMSNPLLVDGKKFDIGVYAVLTSVEPLRAYIYESEALLRFCAQPYLDSSNSNLFNSSNVDSYVVGDDYTPIWLMPSMLRHYIGTNLSMKQSLNTYLRRIGKDGARIWEQIEETIMTVYKSKEHHLGRMSRMFQGANNYNSTSVEGSLNQFFEMVRFDFIVDDDLNVFLMEANMSPNLSSRHFPPNRLLYEQVLSSYFSLVGLSQFAHQNLMTSLPIYYVDGNHEMSKYNIKSRPASHLDSKTASSYSTRHGLDELISEKELSVYDDLCVSDECHMNCQQVDCRVCYFCLDYSNKLHIRRAIFEQMSRWNFKRILPSTRDQDLKLQSANPDHQPSQVDANYIHVQWFRGKCFTDKRFCTY